MCLILMLSTQSIVCYSNRATKVNLISLILCKRVDFFLLVVANYALPLPQLSYTSQKNARAALSDILVGIPSASFYEILFKVF